MALTKRPLEVPAEDTKGKTGERCFEACYGARWETDIYGEDGEKA